MGITFEYSRQPAYLLIEVHGTYGSGDLLRGLDEVYAGATRAGAPKVLLDMRDIHGPTPTTTDRYELGARAAELQRSQGNFLQLSVVGTEPIVDPERFAEVVGANRGAYLRVFTEIDEAVRWLESESAIRQPSSG